MCSSRHDVGAFERSDDPSGKLGRAASIDELENRVQIDSPVRGQPIGQGRVEACSLQSPSTPRPQTDQVGIDLVRILRSLPHHPVCCTSAAFLTPDGGSEFTR